MIQWLRPYFDRYSGGLRKQETASGGADVPRSEADMVNMTAGPNRGPKGIPATRFVNFAAAAVSVCLIGGVGVWGYKLLMRDVTGVPVVRAMQGELRIAPDNPGGEIAAHTGLSVNSVPALGGAAEPEDRLVLAPVQPAMEAEDMEVSPTPARMAETVREAPQEQAGMQEADAVVADVVPDTSASTVPLTAADVLALADQIAAGAEPMSALSEGETVPVEAAVNGVSVPAGTISVTLPGVTRSLRPSSRPAGLQTASASAPGNVVPAAASATAQETVSAEVSQATIPTGTKLVQLGAFDSPEIAGSEWGRLITRFPEFFAGKDQLIQEANSGGRTFFRLRAVGFEELSDARRFCAGLSGEGVACIPVVVR